MICIIDYGTGNIKAFANIYSKLGVPFVIAKKPADLKDITKIILPGVGTFDYAMGLLEKSGLRKVLDELVCGQHLPVLGICVGMQIMAFSSDEGRMRGFGWITGTVKKLEPLKLLPANRLPHMGWNDIYPIKESSLLKFIGSDARFYFLHSYHFQCEKNEDVVAVTDYGGELVSIVNYKNIYGVQFHPEKSHKWGIQLLDNFARI